MKKLVLVFLILLLYTNDTYNESLKSKETSNKSKNKEINDQLNSLRFKYFSYDNLYTYLTLLDVSHKEIILKQAILETGHFKSFIFRQNNNLFGMKMPKKRTTTAFSESNGYAWYCHWTKSVDDYLILQQSWKFKNLLIFHDGYQLLQKAGYAEDPNYVILLKQIKLSNYDSTSDREDTTI